MTRVLLPFFLVLLVLPRPGHAEAVLAATSWAAGLARAAGATEVRTLAPETLQHPPDYDPKPSDLAAARTARFVLLGGFEGFAAALLEAAGGSAQVVRVRLSFHPATVEAEVLRLGALFGTEATAEAFVARWREAVAAARARLQPLAQGRSCLAHAFFLSWAELAGIPVQATFGPKPMTLPQLGELARHRADLILDAAHMPQAQALAEATGARRVLLRNFPGPGEGLLEVLAANTAALEAALQGLP